MGQAHAAHPLCPWLAMELGPGRAASVSLCCCTAGPDGPCWQGCLSPMLLHPSKLWSCHHGRIIFFSLSLVPGFYLQNLVKAVDLQNSTHMYNLKTVPEASQTSWMDPLQMLPGQSPVCLGRW